MVVSSWRFVSVPVSVTLMVGRRRRCWWVWVRVPEVFGLFWALWAGFPAGADHRLLGEGDVAGGLSAGAAAGFGCRCGLGCGVGGWRRWWWRDWWVAAVVGVSVVGEAAVVGVSVGAGDGVAGCADGGGWEGGPVSRWLVRVLWLSVDGAAFGGVLEGGAPAGRECCRQCSGC